MGPLFQDRTDAGRFLARKLKPHAGEPGVIVLALPRGGVPVGYEVARELHAPLDVFVVRKLGVPGNEELAMGAIGSGGVRVMNEPVVRQLQISREVIEAVAREQEAELARRERMCRGTRPPANVEGKKVILVDDGLATGATMRAAVEAVRKRHPAALIVAVPVGAEDTCRDLRGRVDELICGQTPDPFFSVGTWYSNFLETTDEEVKRLLDKAGERERSFAE
ncbi:MAG TPA: phosphoribosyltransferase [Clostridia bacterium]|nr:phosphoribosyltransferase [Clostridia bacterium]